MTRLADILKEQKMSYTAVASHARLQARTVRQLASGETSIDNASVGTIRRIAEALSVPTAALLEPELPYPGDLTVSREARLSAAIRGVMWPGQPVAYASPVEAGEPDDIASLEPEEFFADMPSIDDHRG